jgi:hypothetical protein
MIRAANTQVQQAQVGDIEVQHVKERKLDIELPTNTVPVPNTMHGRTNFVIEQTKGYTQKKLKKFLYCPFLLRVTVSALILQGIVCIICSIVLGTEGQTRSTVNYATLGLSLIVLVSCVILLFIYAQHIHVICGTIPVVLKTCKMVEMRKANAHIEASYKKKESAYAGNQNVLIAAGQEAEASGNFHLINRPSILAVRGARNHSGLIFIALIPLLLWSAGIFLASVVQVIIVTT